MTAEVAIGFGTRIVVESRYAILGELAAAHRSRQSHPEILQTYAFFQSKPLSEVRLQ
jgi:hypothetical protein